MNTRNRFIKFSNLLFIILIFFSTKILAQEYDALVPLGGYKTKVYLKEMMKGQALLLQEWITF